MQKVSIHTHLHTNILIVFCGRRKKDPSTYFSDI